MNISTIMSKSTPAKPSYQDILNGIIQITDKYSIGFIVKGIPFDMINSSVRANMEKLRAAESYNATVQLINDALASSGVGTFNDIISSQQDRENLYKLYWLYRGMLLEEESIQTTSSTLPPKI